MVKKDIRLRFAPSPTGPLHLGNARTALFNWLFAKQSNGRFILRIEDTDRERSRPEYEESIIGGLRWLGISWDEGPTPFSLKGNGEIPDLKSKIQDAYIGDYGPYRQSERLDIYERYLKKLLDERKAYHCYCTKEELENGRQAMLTQGIAPKYSGRCRDLGSIPKDLKPQVIRFKMPGREVAFTDMVRGRVLFDASLFGDIVIAKSVREPLYNFAVVVDDEEMKVSHVIRGEDHLPNTPKQILFAQALGFSEPAYGHLPLILAPDRSKLSKRYAETDLLEYRRNGYLAEAMNNFMALLGWHPSSDEELFDTAGLLTAFDFRRVQKSGAVFKQEKLDWLNAEHLKKMSASELTGALDDFIPSEWKADQKKLARAVALTRSRMKRLADFKGNAAFLFTLPDYPASLLIWDKMTKQAVADNLKFSADLIGKTDEKDLTNAHLAGVFASHADARGRGELLWPLRVAVSGQASSPGAFEIAEALGKEEVLRRIEKAVGKLEN